MQDFAEKQIESNAVGGMTFCSRWGIGIGWLDILIFLEETARRIRTERRD